MNTSSAALLLRRVWLAGLALALCAAFSFAQRRGESAMRAYLSSGVVRLGDKVALIVTVENARSAEIGPLPSVPKLAIGPAGDPSQSDYTQIVNGRVTRSVSRTWVIPLRASEVGEYSIPSFDVVVDGQAQKTQELTLNVVKDLRGEDLGFFEVHPSSKKIIVGQPFSIELVFGFDAAVADKTNYGNLALPWWGNLPGLLENETPAEQGKRTAVYLNDREQIEVEVLPSRQIRGRDFVALRLARSFTPTRTGQLDIPTSFFEFGQVFERRDFFQTRREKGETFFARAPEVSVEVVPLPEAGRPLDYGGAIGNIAVRSDATPRDVDAGESIKLKLDWTGEGNLEFFTAPDPSRLEAFRDFRVYGKTEEKSFDRRSVIYDIAPITSQVREIPPVPLSVYDPEAQRYVVVKSEAIPIRVRALEGASGLTSEEGEERFAKDVRDVVLRPEPVHDDSPAGPGVVLGTLGAIPIGWLALRTLVRKRFDPDAPAERARRRARKQLSRALSRAKDSRQQLDVVYAFLAARTGESPEAWIGQRVIERAPAVAAESARGLDQAIAELEGSVWGERGAALEKERILQAADEAVRGGL